MSVSTSIFSLHYRYLRSTNLEADWTDPDALDSYTYTDHAQQSLARLATGLKTSSTLRAWRITGDYGTGKSSFALLVANVFARRIKELPEGIKKSIRDNIPEFTRAPKLIPVLITGRQEALGYAILSALYKSLKENEVHPNFYKQIENALAENNNPSDELVIDLVKKSQANIIKNKHAGGLLFMLDEAGKFLEYAATHPHKQDIYLLQTLAELCSRSGANPMMLVTIFHQSLGAYSDSLSKSQQREWDKVSGRFEEIVWHFPLEQTAALVAECLGTKLELVSKVNRATAKKDIKRVIDAGWYGQGISEKKLLETAEKLYPIHPSVLPVVVRLFSVFGQNERSLYSFLLGSEPFGLQYFAIKTDGKEFYRLSDLYDYARTNFGAKLSQSSYYWKAIDAAVSSYRDDNTAAAAVLKTIGVINLIAAEDLLATPDIIELATGSDTKRILKNLEDQRLLFSRGKSGDLCVWPNTSIDLRRLYEKAKTTLGELKDFKVLIRERLEARPIVARRHYIETGNLRHFDIRYIEIQQLKEDFSKNNTADGLILVPLCESLKDVEEAKSFVKQMSKDAPNILVVIPTPLVDLKAYLQEVRRWEHIERTEGGLRNDVFARDEVVRQLHAAKQDLQTKLEMSIGITIGNQYKEALWFQNGKALSNISSGKDVMSLLSDICDAYYHASPRIHNELINRRALSAAAAGARLRLCDTLFNKSDQAYLGMDPATHPPEMSIYLSVLSEGGLHKQEKKSGEWMLALPTEAYDAAHCRLLPSLNKVHEILKNYPNQKVAVTELMSTLQQAPYGVRDGLIPLLLAAFAVMHEQELAFYEDGTFIPRMAVTHFLRLIKAPETFDIQYYPISTVRTSLFHKLIHELDITPGNTKQPVILDVVRPLIVFAARLPEYVKNTTILSPQTLAVRNLLLSSTDPVKLIFTELPKACGLQPLTMDGKVPEKQVEEYVEKLKASIDELRSTYPSLLRSLEEQFLKELGISGSFAKNRTAIHQRAEAIAGFITEIGLKSFSLKLGDKRLAPDLWFESLGNLVCAMPPSKWSDKYSYKYSQEIHNLTSQFLRVEATLHAKKGVANNGRSVRVALTQANGEERDQVIHLSPEQAETAQQLEEQVQGILQKHGQVGMAAASSVLWKMMHSIKSNSKN